MDYILGEKIEDIVKMTRYVQSLGYENFGEYLKQKEEPKEYAATVSLLKARLGRIEQLAKEFS